jgi:RNA-binding protein
VATSKKRVVNRNAKKNSKRVVARAAEKVRNRPLTPKRIQYLKGLGHELSPVLSIGKEGLTDAVVTACEAQLLAHELIKVRVQAEAPVDRKEVAAELAARVEALLAQVIGRNFLLYKRHPRKPKIELPA